MIRKSTLEEKNKAMADLYLTLEPERFEKIVNHLITLRNADQDDFNLVLDLFDKYKCRVPPRLSMVDASKNKYIKKDKLNSLLCRMLVLYWDDQDLFQGGYYKHRLPIQQLDERDDDFLLKYNSLYSQMMNDMLDVLKKLNYYETYSGIK
jgi:hypothetical protein